MFSDYCYHNVTIIICVINALIEITTEGLYAKRKINKLYIGERFFFTIVTITKG